MSPYWRCQLAGWSLAGLVTAAIPTLYGGLNRVVVGRAVVGMTLGILLTDQLRRHIRRRGWLQLPLPHLIARIIPASLTIAGLIFVGVLPFLLAIIPPPRAGPLSAIFAGHAALLLIWCGIYLTVHYLRGTRAAEREKWRLQVAMRDTELRALRSQLNPHFLFNSLNSLRGLVGEDPGRAREAITGMAGLLRHAVQMSRLQTVTLERELEATRYYLDLETIRFDSRLRYDIDVEPGALDHPIPPMLLQTLVENAIKHGISRLPEGGLVRIEARKSATDLSIRVTNTGSLDAAAEETGTGMANSLERLRLLFGERAELTLAPSGGGGGRVYRRRAGSGLVNPIRALLVDDERLARIELRRLLKRHPEIEIVGEAANAKEARRALLDLEPELLFLDVQMPGESGFDLLASLDSVPLVVFSTAYDEYAINAFEVSALDYLLKPIDPARLARAVERVIAVTRAPDSATPGPRTTPLSENHRVFVAQGDRCWLVRLGDIRLFEASGNSTRVFFGNEQPLINRSLAELVPRLDERVFFQANRRQIVNLKAVRTIHAWFGGRLLAEIEGGHEVTLSRRRSRVFRERMSV